MSRALADTVAPGDVVRLEGAVDAYARVVARASRGLRVSWHGVDFLAEGRRAGATAGGTPVWAVEAFSPWQEPPPRARRPRKGAATE